MYWNGDWNWGAWGGMLAMMVLFWGLVAAVGVALLRDWRGGERRVPDAHQILDERLARGEIRPDEYRELQETLRR